ncbi:hypothetical protein C8F04DRAFT_1276077 [Mycena alexandri]|uniref:Uncharacterized protein n=1 Tax=Mycena alexandri TaxID=1745969 RepID=A0AAD6S2G5_9AGAR|nr:hypothetical protein C8F04DRAFT_1276077 [Mycena alexandri]
MAQTDGGWCTVSVHDVGADMLGRVLSAHDGGADGWASGVCARRRCRQWLGERCLRKMAAQTRDSADCFEVPTILLPHIYPPCLAGHLSRPFVAGAVDRGICVKKLNFYSASSSECDFVLTNLISSQMCSSQYRASPPYTAVSPSRAFVFMISTADSRMTMDLPSMRSSGSHTYPPYTAVSPSRAFVFGAADRRMTLGGDRLRETMAQTVGAQYLRTTGAQTSWGEWCLRTTGAQAGEANGVCARWRRRHTWLGERCLRKMAAQARDSADWCLRESFEVPTVMYRSSLAFSDVRDGGSSVPAYDGGADRGGEWCLRKTAAQAGEANGVCARWRRRHTWLGEQCLRKMAAQARDSADWCLPPSSDSRLHSSTINLAQLLLRLPHIPFVHRPTCQKYVFLTVPCIYPPCTSGSSSPAFLGGTDRGTYAKKLNFYSASSFECDFVS